MINRNRIENVKVEYYQVPLSEVLSDAKHGDHTHFELVVCRLTCADGTEGVGYTYTGGKGGRAVCAIIEHDLSNLLKGLDAGRIEEVNEHMLWHMHYVARGGLVSFAVSAVDIALWDIRCKRLEQPLWQVAGGNADRVACYAGGIDLNFSLEKLIQKNQNYLDRGFEAVKIKVGQENLKDDVDRVAAIRELIGPDRKFMVDANYSMSLAKAVQAGLAFEPYDIAWFEEPTLPDDYKGYAHIANKINIPLAMGENLHTIQEFTYAIDQARLSYLQPDASNIGGITGWLKVATLAQAHNLQLCSHGMHELHVSLMASQPHAGMMEVHSFPIDEYTTHPFRMENGKAIAPSIPGTGVVFDMNKLDPHRIKL